MTVSVTTTFDSGIKRSGLFPAASDVSTIYESYLKIPFFFAENLRTVGSGVFGSLVLLSHDVSPAAIRNERNALKKILVIVLILVNIYFFKQRLKVIVTRREDEFSFIEEGTLPCAPTTDNLKHDFRHVDLYIICALLEHCSFFVGKLDLDDLLNAVRTELYRYAYHDIVKAVLTIEHYCTRK